ncbi:MAG: beta-ketoacyl-ACP synthase III [Sphingomonadaceae bacterium]
MSIHVEIAGWGKCLPSQILSNYDLEKMVDTSDEWIRSRSGISERRVISEEESTSTIATAAAEEALERAGISASDVDLIILATVTPDYPGLPASASLIQHALGASKAGALDLVAGCSGFVYGLVTAAQFILAGAYRNVLVIGAEALSRIVDWKDRSTCVLFGDGAGAVVLRATDREGGLLSFALGSDGSGHHHLIIPAGGSRMPTNHETVEKRLHHLKMNGREVFKFASRILPRVFHETLEKARVKAEEVDLLIPHQANMRIIDSARESLAISEDAVYVNVNRYGNTSAASIPVALCEAIAEGKVKPGALLAFVAFGAGLTWAAALWRWRK